MMVNVTKSPEHRATYSSPARAGSPAGNSHSANYHSDLTACSAPWRDDESNNFISLLQYRDAYHVLGLDTPPDPQSWDGGRRPSRKSIRDAYGMAREQVLGVLAQCDATEKQKQAIADYGGERSIFLVSQQNYLVLKLQALNQAYEELMLLSEERIEKGLSRRRLQSQNENRNEAAENEERNQYVMLIEKSPEGEFEAAPLPSVESSMGSSGNIASNFAVRSVRTQDPNDRNNQIKIDLHERLPAEEDELDAIDICFRPNPSPNSKGKSLAQFPERTSDVSSCTWDGGSSIFSMPSRTVQQNTEESSEGGLSDVLGMYNFKSSLGQSASSGVIAADWQGKTPSGTTTQSQERQSHHSNSHCFPSGINAKKPRDQISPKSVIDSPGLAHSDNHCDNTSKFITGKAVVGRGEAMKESHRTSALALCNSNEATEAARMGILRALSEDNSECLPLYDDNFDHHEYLHTQNEIQGVSEVTVKCINDKHLTFVKKTGLFQGRSDSMLKENNSLMASVMNHKQGQVPTGNIRPCTVQSHHKRNSPSNRAVSPRRLLPSPKSRIGQQRHAGSVATAPTITAPVSQQSANITNNHSQKEGLLQLGEYSYDAILQSGMELADELCVALNSCWRSDTDLVQTLSCAGSPFASEFKPFRNHQCDCLSNKYEKESAIFVRSTCDGDSALSIHDVDLACNKHSAYTAHSKSTAYSTTRIFSRRGGLEPSGNLTNRNSSMPARSIILSPTALSEPSQRMLV